MVKKPVFTEDFEELDDILEEPKKVEPKKVAPKVMAEEIPIEKELDDDLILANDAPTEFSELSSELDDNDDNEGVDAKTETKAEACEFKIDSSDMLKFLQKIELGGFIKDGYIKVEATRLYCMFNDANNSGSLYGFVGLPTDKGVEIIKTGSFIVKDMKKMGKIVGLFSGKIIVSYADGSIRIASANSKKSSKLISYDKGYVNSITGVATTVVDLDKGKIANYNFFEGSSFSVKKEHLKEILEASEAIENAEFKFNASAENDEIMVYVSNEQDRVSIPFKVLNANIKSDFKETFSLPALNKVIKVLGEDIQVFIISAFILFKSDNDFYVYMANEKDNKE